MEQQDKVAAFNKLVNEFDDKAFSVWHIVYDKLEDECKTEI